MLGFLHFLHDNKRVDVQLKNRNMLKIKATIIILAYFKLG